LGRLRPFAGSGQRSFERLAELGARPSGVADLKFGAAPLPADEARLDALRAGIGERPVILAASTHPGEDEIVLEAFEAATAARPARKALLAIVPRHPDRGPAIANLARSRGCPTLRQGAGDRIAPATAVYVADALGELGLWYRIADLAFIGGSLVPGVGGHNPLEPARLGRPFVSGPKVDNWRAAYDGLIEAGATRITTSASELAQAMGDALDGGAGRRAMASRAQAFVAAQDEAARALPAQILALLP
jgi:3-deoxy-D-manno-octulosonic-acid transferase